jgi:hypothetical protein
MNYEIIKDEKLLREFIDWLPELTSDEKYYLCLFARNKYCKELTHIKSDKAQLKRFVSDKDRMFYKIKQLEVELGAYRQKDIPVPQEALALYITVNPRNMRKASVNTMVKLAHSIRDNNIDMNPHQEALSEIQKSKSRTCYVDFDIDVQDTGELETGMAMSLAESYVNKDAITWLRTRGGYHCLVDPKKVQLEYKNNFYQNMTKIADVVGDNMIPVVGCTQGNFIPHFLDIHHDTIL